MSENKNNDPWKKHGNDSPPDLDELFKKFQDKLSGYMGGKPPRGSGKDDSGKAVAVSFGLIALIVLGFWVLSGIFIVGPAEEAVITRFGRYRTTVGPGMNWVPKFIDRAYVVDVQNVADYPYSSSMLTKDENIVSVELAVQYRINNPEEFLFRVDNPVESLQQATASALRHVVGHTTLSDILTTGREAVRQRVRVQLEQILQRYNTGLVLLDVVMQPATPPEEVKEAFDDAIKAQEDEQRYKHQAEAYEKNVVPVARGRAQRILNDANAYKEKKILQAKGDVSEFNAILPEYKKAPKVTKERLYISAMERVLTKSSKIVLDTKAGNNLTYLPIDKIITQKKSGAVSNSENDNADNGASIASLSEPNVNITSVADNTKSKILERYRARRKY